MARMPRLVVPNYPHHVTQRGNRRQTTFFNAKDYATYLDYLAEAKSNAEVEILAYCLMPNHVHFALVPFQEDSLARLFGEAHRRYTRRVNLREGWQGHLWQERFHSVVMDEQHLLASVRYIELNPVRARLCEHPAQWRWSSARAHLCGSDNALVRVAPMLERAPNWAKYLSQKTDETLLNRLRLHSRTGRPLGDEKFLDTMLEITGKDLRKRKPGRKVTN